VCFQQDLDRGLVTVQRRSAGEALSKYILPFGGGYYYVLPGVDDTAQGDFLGRGLLDAASGSARFSRVARRCLSAPALCPPL
jgi:deferrochelatase/peroxidase EfeB